MYCVLRDKLLSRGRIGAKTDQKIVAKKSAWSKVEEGRSRLKKAGAGGANSRQESAAVLHIKSAQTSYLNRDDAVDDLTRQVGSNQLQVAD